MKAIFSALLMMAVLACGPRQVDMTPGPDTGPDATLRVTNNHTQAVNVYVVQAGTEMLVGQVAANTTRDLPLRGIATQSPVTLRARSTDGTRNWERGSVLLGGTYEWRVP